ncbi:MAG TPA: FHA domain-containing protein [Candidatus Bathyarchaeia archaeon]|nr:FHA domain-containing protein [Candidatus Bathyarchaeia archaeon]
MARIVLEISSSSHTRKELRRFDANEIHIGRGYHNDVIIQDPFVSSSHAVLRRDEQGWLLEDQNSRNGTFIFPMRLAKRVKTAVTTACSIVSGESFQIGTTTVRMFLPEHSIAPTKRFEQHGRFLSSINNRINAAYAIFGFFILYYVQFLYWFPRFEIETGQVFFIEMLIFLFLVIWSSIWAFIGRLIRHKSKFRLHLTLTCFFMIGMVPIINAGSMIGFIFADALFDGFVVLIGGGVAFTLLLMGYEQVSTFLPFRSRLVFSAMIPIVFYLISGIGYFSFHEDFQPNPEHYINVKPPIFRPFFVDSIGDFVINETTEVFEKNDK